MDITILLISIILVSVLFHELGHFTMARLLGYNPKFILKQGNPCVHVDEVNRKGMILISFAGMVFGYISINSLLHIFSYESNMIWYMNIFYVLSCLADIKAIWYQFSVSF